MASSGSYAANTVQYGCYAFINWQIAAQETVNNRTLINWQFYWHFVGSDSQLDNGYVNSNIGTLWSNAGRLYNYAANFTTRDVALSSGSNWISHDANGQQNWQLGIQAVSLFSPSTSAGTSGVWSLDRIPQSPTFSSITADTIKTTSARLGAEISSNGHGTSSNFNMYYRLQGSPTWIDLGNQADVGGFNYWTPTGLIPGKTYEYICNCWNNMGDFAQSATQTFKTLPVAGLTPLLMELI